MAAFPITVLPTRFDIVNKIFKTQINESENGSEQRRRLHNKKRGFGLLYEVDYDDYATMVTFFNSVYGMADSFTFNPHDFDTNMTDLDINVRFTHDTLEVSRMPNGAYYSFRMEMIEDFV